MPGPPVIVTITKAPIRLGQFLKLANLVQDGLEAKLLIQNGRIRVNGVPETQRGKKLTHGDLVMVEGTIYTVHCPETDSE